MTRIMVMVALLVSGCSAALQKRPSAVRSADTSCSSSSAYWIADTVGAVAGVGAVAYGQATGPDMGYLIAGTGALAAVVYLASAHNGYKWARTCRDGHERTPTLAQGTQP